MKNLLFFLLLFFTACNSKYPSERDCRADRLIADFSKTLASKDFRVAGIGGGIDHSNGKHKLFSLTLSSSKKVEDLNQAREILVETITAFIDFINQNESIRDHLANFPVTIKNISLGFIFEDSKAGNIVSMFNCGEILSYSINLTDSNASAIPKWKEICEETFEEAKEILRMCQSKI